MPNLDGSKERVMTAFRVLLVAIFATIVVYTSLVIANHGLGLLSIFLGDMQKMGWPGQFNLDFVGFLLLSGFWLAWRHHFSPLGLALGVFGFFGGAPVLTAYLFITSFTVNGDVRALLMGHHRAYPGSGRT
jgi:hypothetical protein